MYDLSISPSFSQCMRKNIYHGFAIYISEVFQMSRVIRQGCSVSALLFVISVEILATKIRQCSSLNGLTLVLMRNQRRLRSTLMMQYYFLIIKKNYVLHLML